MSYFDIFLNEISFINKIGTKRFKIFAGILILSVLYIIYLTSDLFFVQTLNDFDEYFNRAQLWYNGAGGWNGGSDRLLSVFELIGIYFFPKDFIAIYRTTIFLIVTFLFTGVALFVYKENDLLPGFYQKIAASVFFLTMPFFLLSSVTIEQSILLSAALILFFSTYRNPYCGIIAYLVTLARPEGIFVGGLYIIMLIFDKKYRKQILINFISFLIIFAGMKLLEMYVFNPQSTFVQEEYNTGVKYDGSFFLSFLYGILGIPLAIIVDAFELSQNYIVLSLFVLGLIISIRNKKMYMFFGVLIGYKLLQMITFGNVCEFGALWNKLEFINSISGFVNTKIQIASAFNPEMDKIMTHSRYRLFLIPVNAIFVVAGLYFIYKKMAGVYKNELQVEIVQNAGKQKSGAQKNVSSGSKFDTNKYLIVLALPLILFIFIFLNNIKSQKKTLAEYKTEYQFQNMHDIFKASIELRKHCEWNDYVMVDEICEGSQGAFPAIMVVYSGLRNIAIHICPEQKYNYWCDDFPPGKNYVTEKEIYDFNITGGIIMYSGGVSYRRSFDAGRPELINKAYQYDLDAMKKLGIKYIMKFKEFSNPAFTKIITQGTCTVYKLNE